MHWFHISESAYLRVTSNETGRNRTGIDHAPRERMLQSSAIDKLTEKVIGCAIAVHSALGPGLLESIYCACLMIELLAHGLRVEAERRVIVEYRGQRVAGDLRLDLVVDDCLIVEVKAVERLHPVHQAQVITYLKLTGLPAGLLMNFNETTLRAGLKRLDHPSRYFAKPVVRPGHS